MPAAVHRRLLIAGRMPDEVKASVFERLQELNEPERGPRHRLHAQPHRSYRRSGDPDPSP
ncbi:MAG: hypothetical protein E6H01_08560 [Bacillati bacterium ANGP1]|uniref:Uncharacterized protein n=1 Tax=Candidatus Segetimicrobium genomatis TaxID=2569760 RepID=A0A537KYB6_9BACT|nr:MAG: hypothetical protein E6H01_08560 [Terrabacteria group bacterium ANGP1]